jgi:hypothetical protein
MANITIDLLKDYLALEKLMGVDHVIEVHENGTVSDDIAAVWAPQAYDNAAEGEPEDIHVSDGWTLLRGFTAQYAYTGPVMGDGEFVGGALARHILDTPGYWAVIVVTAADGSDAGWAVAHRER